MKQDEDGIVVQTADRQRQIERLQRHHLVELKAVREFHAWLDDKRHCRQACRVVGESRTGKTFACNAYWSKNVPKQMNRTDSDHQPPGERHRTIWRYSGADGTDLEEIQRLGRAILLRDTS